MRHYRTHLQFGLAIALVAVPLLAYANSDTNASNVAQIANVTPPSTENVSDRGVATTRCDSQNWPNYSSDCVQGQRNQIKLRQIALVASDVPLKSLPRVIDAPPTQQHVVTVDLPKTNTRPLERRRVAQRVVSRPKYVARTESPVTPMFVSENSLPAGW